MRITLAIAAVLLLSAARVQADLQLCGDVWTNRDCADAQQTTLTEKPYQPPDEGQRLAERKKFMLTELDLRRLRVTREQGINFEIESARAICGSLESTLAHCQKAVNDANEQLDKRIASASIARPEPVKQKESVNNQTVVTIIDDDSDDGYYNDRRHRKLYRGDHGRYDSTSAGIGITAQTSSSSGSIGVTAGIGSAAPGVRPGGGGRPDRGAVSQPAQPVQPARPAQRSLSAGAQALR